MEKESIQNHPGEHEHALILIKQARDGDKQAIEQVLQLFDTDIRYLAQFIKMPREDAIQELVTELIAMIKRDNIE
ncbi:Putative uncharacterized protein [Thermobacillus xylanilyticus]|jgi:DNA-directed RNA polymerase subunit F|uniref:Helix-turn-helix conjugative transposon-like domain-containing protein n=1 Tax=Thermobacillus xylanilyticus TaxID=76633 RepID=A0ABM8V1G1_THEXY|nr:helix-turn-helix domain-containing protein [Thermobacillus xylanilyticus]CAG5080851.1 Putative uncharacterized protein [Thermobacillus xylanilyticus]